MGNGRQEILTKISKSSRSKMIGGLVFALIGLVLMILIIITGNADGNAIFLVIMGCFMAAGIAIMAVYIPSMLDPMKSGFIKKNPEVLDMADELFANLIYRDKNLMFSSRIIASATDIRQMSYTDEVFLIYVYIHKTNGVTDSKMLKLETARKTISLPIFAMKDDEINSLIGQILQQCRYARVGYNQDGMNYLAQMKGLWKKDQESKKMHLN